MKLARFHQSLRLSALTATLCLLGGAPLTSLAQTVSPGTTDLLTTPPELTTSVDPNIVVTFDDSGSMQSHFMGDTQPFNGAGWGAPYGCAGVIGGDSAVATRSMNGVYYNPNIRYIPPVKADGTSFPQSDATLAAVWEDGIAINRPLNPVGVGSAGYNNNPNSGTGANDSARTIINGNKVGGTDHRWTCGYGSYPTAFAGGEAVNNGGPYYYRLKNGVVIPVDSFGNPTVAARTTLYTAGNWEAVYVPNTTINIEGVPTNQWQNFANWYSYYRTRNLMTRTALSRVFGGLSGSVRVAWQNINDGTYALSASAIITKLLDKAGVACSTTSPTTAFTTTTQPDCYRSAFFNWVFQTGANGSTPDRAATIRAGDFFKRGSSTTTSLLNPYWQLPDTAAGVTTGRELSCRQNFNMLVTDGYWNEGDPTLPTAFTDAETPITLPDGTAYSVTAPESRVFWDVVGTKYQSSLANIAFHYWANDLRTDLPDKVNAYLPDKTIGITGSAAASIDPPIQNTEIYFNPANDPASWQHVVEFMVTLGVSGNLQYVDDPDCGVPNSEMCQLRRGLNNSTGVTGWPRPINNNPAAIDDTWHAAVNSRGSYFSASNPGDLVSHLNQIINNVLARGASSTPVSVSLPILTGGNSGYSAGYDSTDWSGSLRRDTIDPNTAVSLGSIWDAGCLLTGGTFDAALAKCTPPSGAPWAPGFPSSARDPLASRFIVTSLGLAGTGKQFSYSLLDTATQQWSMRQKAGATGPCDSTAAHAVNCDTAAVGLARVNYIRGIRTAETGAAPNFRKRSSVLGSIINGAPVYVSSPRGGYHDIFPDLSPEQNAVTSNAATDQSYARYQNTQFQRTPMVYVGSDDGMLHAFNAASGYEQWAYIPNTLIQNLRLAKSTNTTAGLTPGVDSAPREADVFISNADGSSGAWRTYLVGSLRLGGRGVYALDVTSPLATSEAGAAASLPQWEFNSGPVLSTAGDPECAAGSTSCSSLGYTYDSANVVRLKYQNSISKNSWVALVSSGYFPSRPEDAATATDASEPAAARTSLMVVDMKTGKLIRELRTSLAPQTRPTGFKTYGLSTPMVYDLNSDEVGDLAYAGDLAGNLWRFDMQDTDPANWKVDLMFTTYGNGGATNVGDQPIVFNPTALRDPTTRKQIIVVGTGKYLGRDDRTSSIPAQAYYGVRDYGTASAFYPLKVNQLVTQNLSQTTTPDAVRSITGWTLPTGSLPATTPFMRLGALDTFGQPTYVNRQAHGWRIPLTVPQEPGERAQRRAVPLFSANIAVLYSLIPKGDDPCDPGARYALLIVDAANGGAITGANSTTQPGTGIVGEVMGLSSPPGDPVITRGGGKLIVPGLTGLTGPSGLPLILDQVQKVLDQGVPVWHRSAWRELLDMQ